MRMYGWRVCHGVACSTACIKTSAMRWTRAFVFRRVLSVCRLDAQRTIAYQSIYPCRRAYHTEDDLTSRIAGIRRAWWPWSAQTQVPSQVPSQVRPDEQDCRHSPQRHHCSPRVVAPWPAILLISAPGDQATVAGTHPCSSGHYRIAGIRRAGGAVVRSDSAVTLCPP